MYKTLVIGCGNIGAQYDMYNNEVHSHVKAWHLNPLTNVFIYDINRALAQQVSDKYACKIIKTIDFETLRDFDCVSICTPTVTHLEFLEQAMAASVNTIICEKPVSNNYSDLEKAEQLYNKNSSKILVNYMRRFLPSFAELKSFIDSILKFEELTNISIRYQRGFLNNCSHAFDLIEYLFNRNVMLKRISKHNIITDHFNDDPTLSLQALWGNVNFNVHGLTNVCFSHFEIDIYFKFYKIVIKNAGDSIEIYKSEVAGNSLKPLLLQQEYSRHNNLKNYMKFVTDYAVKLMSGEFKDDNFITSVNLNKKMLEYKEN